jgi:hypothetical protein
MGLVSLAGSLALGPDVASAATGSVTLTGGSLAITATPTNFTYPSTVLTGSAITLTSSFSLTVDDATGSGAGWNLTASAPPLTDSVGNTIPAGNQTIESVVVSGVTGTAPTNGVSYPMGLPTSTAKIFSANANTGRGQSTETFNLQLVVPADAFAGTYTTSLTVSLISGP